MSPEIIAMYPAFIFLVIVLYFICRNASRRSGIPVWRYFIGTKEVRKTLSTTEQILGVLAQLGALAIFFGAMKVAALLTHSV
jgi:hypothetical protein